MRRSVRAADRHPRRSRRRLQPLPRHPPTAADTRQPALTTAPCYLRPAPTGQLSTLAAATGARCPRRRHRPLRCRNPRPAWGATRRSAELDTHRQQPPSPPPTPAAQVVRPRRRPHPPGSRPGRQQPPANHPTPTFHHLPPSPPPLAPPTHKKAPKILLRGFSSNSQRRQPALSPQCATPPGRPGRPRRGRRSQTRLPAAPSDPRRCPRPAWPCASCRCLRWPRPSRDPCQPRA